MNKFYHFAYLIAMILILGLLLVLPRIGDGDIAHAQTAKESICNPSIITKIVFGEQGKAVQNIQACLIQTGFSIPAGATGYYGAQTASAISKFYASSLGIINWNGRSIGPLGRQALKTGLLGSATPTPQTINTNSGCIPALLAPTAFGERNEKVTQMQECLISIGYIIPAGATGYYGAQTAVAVKQFYNTNLNMPQWHGRSMGPIGQSALSALVNTSNTATSATGWKRAVSESDVQKYIDTANDKYALTNTISALRGGIVAPMMAPELEKVSQDSAGESSSVEPRYSETNVQVLGIDEPDIVKTDGTHIYISNPSTFYYIQPFIRSEGDATTLPPEIAPPPPSPLPISPDTGISAPAKLMMPQYQDDRHTSIVTAFPLATLGIASDSIKEQGEMLLVREKNMLIIFTPPNIVAYNIADPKAPVKKWTYTMEDNTSLLTARRKNNDIYLITQTWLERNSPCPMYPIIRDSIRAPIPCTSIWVPSVLEPINVTYTIAVLDPTLGNIKNTLTFGGDSDNTVISMFENNIYLSYSSQSAMSNIYITFYKEEMKALLPASTIQRIKTIAGYDISNNSKLNEIQRAIESTLSVLTHDERLKMDNNIQNALANYLERKIRETDTSSITRIATDTLTIASSGTIPGHLLNQFSLDEYMGNLRVAVTVGDQWRTQGGTKNDIYVLNENMQIIGQVQDLGLTERIYAVRFIKERGYLVTFRQIDPFYVIDLQNPYNPKMVGELKIPGFSSYLEPIDANTVLGVGREAGAVKLSLFDVSNPTAPKEKSKYTLAESWTDVENNHRAFLRDPRHQVFFLPAGNNGYIFSYNGAELSLKTAIKGESIKRAIFINDYLYIVGNDKLTVLNENTWKQEAELSLTR